MTSPSAGPAADTPSTPVAALAAIDRVLRETGERRRLRPDWILLPDGLAILQPLVTDLSDGPVRRVQILVPTQLAVEGQRNMYPITVGEGASYAAAMAAAASNWVRTALPTFRAAMAELTELTAGIGYQVDILPAGQITLRRLESAGPVHRYTLDRTSGVEGPDARWQVFGSDFALNGSPDACDSLNGHFSHLPPLAMLLRRLHGALNAGSVHWLQLIARRLPEGSLVITCLLDNEPWEAGKYALYEGLQPPYPWPECDTGCGFHQYILLRPAPVP